MAGMMYNVGINFLAKNGVSPSLLKISADAVKTSASMLGLGLQIKRSIGMLPGVLKPFSLTGGGMLRSLATGAAFYGTARGVRAIVEETGRFEVANMKFAKLIGNAELAQKTLRQMEIFAAQTPFEFKQSQEISVGLLAAGVQAKELIPTMRMLGDLAMGDPEKVSQLAYAFSKVKMTGVASWRSLSMFATAGVPIFEELRKQLNLDQKQLESHVRSRKVGFEDLLKVMVALSGQGGKFFGLMAEQMATLPGLWSNFLDIVGMVQRHFGSVFKESLKSVILQMDILGLKILKWIDANREMLQLKVGGFFERIAEGMKNIDIQKLFDSIAAFMQFAKVMLIAVVVLKTFTTAAAIGGSLMFLAGIIGTFSKIIPAALVPALLKGTAGLSGMAAAGTAAGAGMTAVLWPIIGILGIFLLLLAGIWAIWQKLHGRRFFGGRLPAAQSLGTNEEEMANVQRMSEGLSQGGGTAGVRGVQNLASLSQIEKTTNLTRTMNQNSNVTLTLGSGLQADQTSGRPVGINWQESRLGNTLKGY